MRWELKWKELNLWASWNASSFFALISVSLSYNDRLSSASGADCCGSGGGDCRIGGVDGFAGSKICVDVDTNFFCIALSLTSTAVTWSNRRTCGEGSSRKLRSISIKWLDMRQLAHQSGRFSSRSLKIFARTESVSPSPLEGGGWLMTTIGNLHGIQGYVYFLSSKKPNTDIKLGGWSASRSWTEERSRKRETEK